MENVFGRQISRAQQDAHEFLQVVAETLATELERQRKLEKELHKRGAIGAAEDAVAEDDEDDGGVTLDAAKAKEEEAVVFMNPPGESTESEPTAPEPATPELDTPKTISSDEKEFKGMPLEGKLKSEIECQTCGFKPKPTISTFVVLTLPVPQKVCFINLLLGIWLESDFVTVELDHSVGMH